MSGLPVANYLYLSPPEFRDMEDSREHILKTAYQLFLQKSYKAVTFKELMEKTGFSKGAFYHYFQSKEHIFEAIIDDYLSRYGSINFAGLSQNSLRGFIDDYLKAIRLSREALSATASGVSDKNNHYLLLFEAIRIIPGFTDKIINHQQKEMLAWMSIISSAKQKKEIKSSVKDGELARLFISSSDGVMLHRIMTGQALKPEIEIEEVWNNLYVILKG